MADEPPSTPSAGTPNLPWNDGALAIAFILVGVLVAVVAILFMALVQAGVCWAGCSGPHAGFLALLPVLMALVPVGYAVLCWHVLRRRRQRAARDPAWAARSNRGGARLAIALTALLLAAATLVTTCFGLVGIGSWLR